MQQFLSTQPSTNSTRDASAAAQMAQIPSDGQALDASVRAHFERGFAADLSKIRIHTGANAASAAESLNADAYAAGRDIVFGADRYRPSTTEGQHLLAHEIAHSLQQGGQDAAGMRLPVRAAVATHEREADRAADAIAAGGSARVHSHPGQPAIARKPKKMIRADRFLPPEKAKLKAMGRGELDDLIDVIVADGKYHQIRQQTINGVEHTWQVKTEISELSEEEQSQGAKFGGALTPDHVTTSKDGKQVLHQNTYILRGGQASTLQSALHELIHLRISIDRALPPAERSSYFEEYNQFMEMSEVIGTAKFGDKSTIDEKGSYGALPIVTGGWERVKTVLKKIEAIRGFYLSLDPSAKAKFDSELSLQPSTLIEYLIQEKYVTQSAAKATSKSGSAPSNDTIATRYASVITERFAGFVTPAAQTRAQGSAIGGNMKSVLVDGFRLSLKNLYDALEASLKQAQEFSKNPPKRPDNFLPDAVFESRPVDIDGTPIPLK